MPVSRPGYTVLSTFQPSTYGYALNNYLFSLECQLNTIGVRGALHESILGWSAAWTKFTEATGRNETRVAPAPTYTDVFT
jgi:hypothetical protein